MKKVEGDITVCYSATCPYCGEYQNTDHDKNIKEKVSNASEYWFCEFDDETNNLVIECANNDCKKEFIIEKFTHLTG